MKYLTSTFKIVVAVGLFALLFRNFNIKLSELVTEIKDWRYVAAGLFMSFTIIPYISINRWQLFLKVSGIFEGFFTLWYINLKALFQGMLIPSTQGFDVLRIYYIDKRNPLRRGHAGSTVLIERMIGMVLLCLLSLFAVLFVEQFRAFPPLLFTILTIFGAVLVAIGLISSQKIHRFYTGYKFKHKTIACIFGYIDTFHGAIVNFSYRDVMPMSIVWITAYQLAIVFTIYLIFCAYGYVIPFVQHVAIYPVIAILSMVPITIGGFGVREGFFVFFYSLVGVPPAIAIGVSILQYIILNLIPASLGGLIFLREFFLGFTIRR